MRLENMKNRIAVLTIFCLILSSVSVFAAADLSVTESCTGDTQVVFYLKGVSGDLSKIRVEAGTAVCSSVTACRLADSGQTVKTLIMLDNSLSIKKADRIRIGKIMRNIIDTRMEQEEIAVALFQEGITWLSDYTSDEKALRQAAAKISYQSSNTYLTDVLYELLSAQKTEQPQDVYRRIVIISDGMDNKSIGYTKDELNALLKEYPVPVYTIGVWTKKGNNQKQLENMFAISRMTAAESFLLSDTNKLPKIGQALQEDGDIVRLTVCPPDELLDGSRKMFKITLDSGRSVSAEAAMPQQAKALEQQPAAADKGGQMQGDTGAGKDSAQAQDAEDAQGTKDGSSAQKSAGIGKRTVVLLAALFLAAAAAAAVFIRKKKAPVRAVSRTPAERTLDTGDDEPTDIMEMTEAMDDEQTVTMEDATEDPVCNLVLTDIQVPERSFQIPVQTSAVIGRKQGMCAIVIQDDMSVSGRHCEIIYRDGDFYIKDLQSSNGTCVNGRRIWSETKIEPGNRIRMGKSEFTFDIW